MRMDDWTARRFLWLVGLAHAALLPACASEPEAEAEIDLGVNASALELGCRDVPADLSVDVTGPNGTEVTTVPRNGDWNSRAQSYGSSRCSGFVIDMHNPNGRSAANAFFEVNGWVETAQDLEIFGTEERCSALELEGDVYGFRNGLWTALGWGSDRGRFEQVETQDGQIIDSCLLHVEVVQPGNYETWRLAGRVSNETRTYPFRAHVY